MRRIVWGILLVVFGSILLLMKLDLIAMTWGQLWPVAMLLAGLAFELFAAVGGRSSVGLVVPGGILLVYGALFTACSYVGWHLLHDLWPLYLLGPALGLFSLYLFGGNEKGLLVPVGILGGLGVGFLVNNLFHVQLIWPLMVISAGLIVFFTGFRKNQR